MNAALPRHTLEDATRLDTLPADPKDRRGPFRPEKLVSARERRSGDMFVRLFRTIDFLALVFFAVICARSVAPQGFFTSPLGNILPFIAT
ncbi:MAG TPA: UDP-phosphate glucose phosphotransferase, partial [Asticcacaulis sp.]|nr:UDP-phosphate glucose phosphotransferase [Asticcacaulis sp.]